MRTENVNFQSLFLLGEFWKESIHSFYGTKHFDRYHPDSCIGLIRRDIIDRLKRAQMEGSGSCSKHSCSLSKFLGSKKLSLRIDDLCTLFSLCLCLFAHGALQGIREIEVFEFY